MIPLALLCATLIGLIVYLLRHSAAQEREWARERQLLITRLQHPEIVPPVSEDWQHPEQTDPRPEVATTDEIDLVGTVQTFNGDSD